MRYILASLAAAALCGAVAAQAPNRPFGPAARPTYSPYLNLLRGGNSTTFNYYGLVRPEQDARRAAQNLQGQIFQNRQSIENQAAATTELPGTGDKTVGFLNTGGYFMNLSPQGTTGGAGGAGFGTLGGATGGRPGTAGGGRAAPPPPRAGRR